MIRNNRRRRRWCRIFFFFDFCARNTVLWNPSESDMHKYKCINTFLKLFIKTFYKLEEYISQASFLKQNS